VRLPEIIVGVIEQSTMRSPSTPRTRNGGRVGAVRQPTGLKRRHSCWSLLLRAPVVGAVTL
jgi:hypothetical protein